MFTDNSANSFELSRNLLLSFVSHKTQNDCIVQECLVNHRSFQPLYTALHYTIQKMRKHHKRLRDARNIKVYDGYNVAKLTQPYTRLELR